MNTASAQTHSSLAQRLATVRNCMLVELSTGVSPTDKDLFTSLCQTYEQNSVMTSHIASTSSQNAVYQAFSISDPASESILPHELAGMSGRNTPPKQHRIGFSIIRWPTLADGDDSFKDWDNGGR